MSEDLSRYLRVLLTVGALLLMRPHPLPDRMAESLVRARDSFGAGKTEDGLQAIEDAVAFAPYLLSLLGPAAETALESGQPERALRLSLAASRGFPDSAAIKCLIDRSRIALEEGGTIADLDVKEVAACRQGRTALARAARTMFEQGLNAQAREIVSYLLKQPADLPRDAVWLAALFMPEEANTPLRNLALQEGTEHSLARDLVAVLAAPSRDTEAGRLARVGYTFTRHGEWRLAALGFAEAIRLEPENAQAHAYLGLAMDQLGLDGREEIVRAGELDPADPAPPIFLGLHWLHAGDMARARQELERALRLDPSSPALLLELGRVQALLGDIQGAKAHLLEATSVEPGEPRYWTMLAQFSTDYEIEVTTLGIPSARNALVLSDSCALCLDLLGYGYYLSGNLPLAERFLWRAVVEAPDEARTLYHLGLLLASQGKTGTARQALDRALAVDADGAVAPLVVRTLDSIAP